MILQALNRYYHILLDDPETDIAPPGFSSISAHLAIVLSEDGEMLGLTSLMTEEMRGRAMKEVPIRLRVPEQVVRARKITPNFLWDNATYVLGVSERDDTQPEYATERHQAFKEHNLNLLAGASSQPAKAVCAFLNRYDPDAFKSSDIFQENVDLLKTANLVFRIIGDEGYVHDDPEIKRLWKAHLKSSSDAPVGQCLVTGEVAEIERTHAKIKGVPGGQSVGTVIVGFNESAYESFNKAKKQGLNSPISKEAAFGYTTALNYLLRDRRHNLKLNDTTVVYWAESPDKKYVNLFNAFLDPAAGSESSNGPVRDRKGEELLRVILSSVKEGRQVDQTAILKEIDGDTRFHVLGLSPNAARLSIRFYYTDPFIKAIGNLLQHHNDMLITNEFGKADFFPIWRIIKETVSPKAKKSAPAPLLTGAVFRSILMNQPYPAALYNAILIRIRADQDDREKGISKINPLRVAIVKAFLIRKYRNQNKYQEELQMSLNKDSTNQAYLLGRLFAVLERAQLDALGNDLNATIKDRYFTSACATPANAFPILLRLSQHHISKAEWGRNRDRDIQEIMEKLDVNDTPFPKHLTLDEQGIFVLGYYHQKADFFKKRPAITDNTPEEE